MLGDGRCFIIPLLVATTPPMKAKVLYRCAITQLGEEEGDNFWMQVLTVSFKPTTKLNYRYYIQYKHSNFRATISFVVVILVYSMAKSMHSLCLSYSDSEGEEDKWQ